MNTTIKGFARAPGLDEVSSITKLLAKQGYHLRRVDPAGTRGHWCIQRDRQTFISSDWHSVKAIVARMEGGNQ